LVARRWFSAQSRRSKRAKPKPLSALFAFICSLKNYDARNETASKLSIRFKSPQVDDMLFHNLIRRGARTEVVALGAMAPCWNTEAIDTDVRDSDYRALPTNARALSTRARSKSSTWICIVLKRSWARRATQCCVAADGHRGESAGSRKILGICEEATEDKAGWSGLLMQLKVDAVQVNVGMLAFNRPIAPRLDRAIDLLVEVLTPPTAILVYPTGSVMSSTRRTEPRPDISRSRPPQPSSHAAGNAR